MSYLSDIEDFKISGLKNNDRTCVTENLYLDGDRLLIENDLFIENADLEVDISISIANVDFDPFSETPEIDYLFNGSLHLNNSKVHGPGTIYVMGKIHWDKINKQEPELELPEWLK